MREGMSERTYHDNRQETAIVKQALQAAGIPYRKVSHGDSTTALALNIYLGHRASWATWRRALAVVLEATGRTGTYVSNVNTYRE